MGIYGGLHSFLAGQRPRLLARRLFGAAGRRWYRLAYNLVAGFALILVLALIRALPDEPIYRIPMPIMLVTMALQGIGILSIILVLYETGIRAFVGLSTEDAQQPHLVTDGLYQVMRHPLYAGTLLLLWLFPTMSWNLLAFNLGATLYILLGIRFEERRLLREYGKKYADYRKKTPMLFPLPGFGKKAG
jgi:protein-S-isoprenylcysteine O-methyltransferase Ste14